MHHHQRGQNLSNLRSANIVRRRGGGSAPQALIEGWLDQVAPAPWAALAGGSSLRRSGAPAQVDPGAPLYTPEERARRDASVWTLVQGVLAPLQFIVFLVSLVLVLRALVEGHGHAIAAASVMLKTGVLFAIMITGSIWEKVVFGKWLFAPAFFWEDVVSIGVIALHTLYVAAYVFHWGTAGEQFTIALAAYAAYVVNAAQFLWKLRQARLEGEATGAAA